MPRPWLPMSAGCGALRSATSRRTRPTRTGSCWRRPCFSFPRARCRFVANRADKTCYISLKNPRVGYSAAMAEVLLVLLLAIEIAFAVLAIRTVAAWIHQPDRRHGNLAIAIGSLAIVMLLAPSLTGTGANTQLLTDLAAVIFLVSGYGLLMFRDSFVPFGVAKTRLVTLLTVAGTANDAFSVVIDLFALATVPVLYVAFFPPVWLRRIWRQPEEDQFRNAMHELLLYSPDRATLADRALVWAVRLVGGDAAFMLDSDGSVLAARDIGSADAASLSKRFSYLSVV